MVQRILERGEIESLDHNAIPRLRLPAGESVFKARAARLRRLAANEIKGTPVSPEFSGYLLLMAALVDAQQAIFVTLTSDDAPLPDQAALALAREHAMPPLLISAERPAIWRNILERLLTQLQTTYPSPHVTAISTELLALEPAVLESLADAVLAQRTEFLTPSRAPFIAAALQVLWTWQASKLSLPDVPTLEIATLCPVCGSHPVASVIRIGGQSQGYRYLQCSLCSSEWHMVRVKCSHCEQNGKIAYQSLALDDAAGSTTVITEKPENKANDPQKVARAETCDDCYTYRKIFNQEHDYDVEPLADDLASLMLDVLVAEAGYTRASGHPLLWFGDSI